MAATIWGHSSRIWLPGSTIQEAVHTASKR